MLLYAVLRNVPTLGGVIAVFCGWAKISVLAALVRWYVKSDVFPLLVTLCLYVPLGLLFAVRSGHTPLSLDFVIPFVLILAFFKGVRWTSIVYVTIAVFLLSNFMFAWMASRGIIRRGELQGYPILTQLSIFIDTFAKNIQPSAMTPEATLDLVRLRLDMSDILAMEVGHMPDYQPFRYGGTLVDGAYALIPRVLWPEKPMVAGGSDFVSKYTGMVRPTGDETSIGLPMQFELFANGGAILVVVGLFIFTWSCARLERLVMTEDKPIEVVFPCLMVLISFGGGITQIMVVVCTSIAGGVGIYILLFFIKHFHPGFYRKLAGI